MLQEIAGKCFGAGCAKIATSIEVIGNCCRSSGISLRQFCANDMAFDQMSRNKLSAA